MVTDNRHFSDVAAHFCLQGEVIDVKPLGNGLINDTLKITTAGSTTPDYVLQRINNNIFTDVPLLQRNIEVVTQHIRAKLLQRGEKDIDRKVLTFVPTKEGKTYFEAPDGTYWRVAVFIPDAYTYEAVTPEYSYSAGRSFSEFEAMLTDVPEQLGETIPDFHNMALRRRQLDEATKEDKVGRVKEVSNLLNEIYDHVEHMCMAEELYKEGRLPKRICHCDTKVNNMLFDKDGHVLCVIDLDTVMPSFVFSDYGDFLRTGANFVAEDCPDMKDVGFNMEIFRAFTEGYIEGSESFLTPIERDNLPFAAALFPFMQAVRFLTDYINGDTYYKIQYPEHNLVRTENQMALFRDVVRHEGEMNDFIKRLTR